MNPTAPDPLTVEAALSALRSLLAAGGPDDWTVVGTLTSWRVGRNRWGRGDLCDTTATGDGISHRLPIALPSGLVTQLRHRAGGEDLPDGSLLQVTGRIEIGDRWNPLRLVASSALLVDPESELTRSRQALLDQLRVSGAADRNRRLALPPVIRRLGLITAATGEAGRRDFLLRLAAYPSPITVNERRTPLSGPVAPRAIAEAVDELGGLSPEVIVICRGGGASSDLAAFDTAEVATAIARSPVPVLLGIGHSTDRTVADLTAHTSVATPTAAADWLVGRATKAASSPAPQPVPEPPHSVPTPTGLSPRGDAGRRLLPAACVILLVVFLLYLVLTNKP